MKVAVVGLGSMGAGMAVSLLRAGLSVIGYDVSPERRAQFALAGGAVADSVADAASNADVVVSVVLNAAQTESVLFGGSDANLSDAGVARVMAPDGVFVSCATVPPRFATDMAARLEATGRHYIDAPMSGGAGRAAEGKLTVMASGSAAAFERAGPALNAVAETVYRLGDQAGVGSAFKLVNQLLAGVHIAAASEAIALAARLGLDLPKVYEVISQSAGSSWMFQNRIPHVLAGDYAPLSAVEIFTKDLGIVGDVARGEQFPTPMASAALQLFIMTAAAGMARDDDSSVARLFAQIAGIDLPQKSDA
jgi:L-threonate 2-dehydrogenase